MANSICNDILSVLFLELQGRVYKNVQNSGSLIKKKTMFISYLWLIWSRVVSQSLSLTEWGTLCSGL